MNSAGGCIAGLVLVGFAGSVAAHDSDSWTRTDDMGSNPISKTTHEELKFTSNGRVDVRKIGGNVEVTAGDGSTVDLVYQRRAASQQDFDCETFHYERNKDTLRIWVEAKKERACREIRATDKLTLVVPRGAEVSLVEIGDSVKVSGVEGRLRLSSIGDSATLTGVQQLDAESIGDSLKLEVPRLGPAGIKIESVGDSVQISLPESLDARLRIDSVGDEVRGPNLRLTSMNGDYETVLGKGGPMISISSVGDSVIIKRL